MIQKLSASFSSRSGSFTRFKMLPFSRCSTKPSNENVTQTQTKDSIDEISPIIEDERLWSNLNPQTLKHEPGSIFGAAALVAGTTVGAGILALPNITQVTAIYSSIFHISALYQESGFVASSVALCGICLYSVITGLLIAEVNINTMCELGSGGVSLTSMAERTLGKTGTRVASAVYVFLHYALLVSYISKGSSIIQEWIGFPPLISGSIFCFVLGGLCYGANTPLLNKINFVLVAAVIATFAGLLLTSSQFIDIGNLTVSHWNAIPGTFSILSLAFVYHNVVPVIISNLEGDIKKIRTSIFIGTLIPLAMFVSWNGAILGSITDRVEGDPLQALQLSQPTVAPLIQSFSFLALATSYIGFVLGLTDFVSDAMKLPTGRQPIPYLITLLPPLGFAMTYPDVFFQALDAAGTYGVLVLFGILPALMAWSERYNETTVTSIQVVPGGRTMLILIGGGAGVVVLTEFLQLIGIIH